MLEKPVFIISLDTELAWGFISNPQHRILAMLRERNSQSRQGVDILLSLFDKYEIPATWAIVGHLFLNRGEASDLGHARYLQNSPNLSTGNETLYFGEDIVEKILSSPLDHEIGWHSFSHPDFTALTREQAYLDTRQTEVIARKWGIEFESFIFPQNKIAHLDVVKDNGFKIYRGSNCFYKAGTKGVKKYLQLGMSELIPRPVKPTLEEGVWRIPTSMEFFDEIFPRSLLPRARFGLWMAIRTKRVFHVFLHPWSLLVYDRLASDLDRFLNTVYHKRKQGILKVMTMRGLAEYLSKQRSVS